jgi:hypothetical protein
VYQVVVVDARRFASACELKADDMRAYLDVLEQLSRGMEREGYSTAFVHLDRLRAVMK